ncbi:MAG: DUF3786 domain-containing protein [Spirochaetaceae bacterium]|jgi:hypothetical protein|nr:DUF3786 domain-containing protein [Spirochaetaceae bacterium]
MEKGFEITYNWVKKLLNDCDFSDCSKRLGLKQASESSVLINFFDRTYKISHNNIELIEQKTIWTVNSEAYEFDLKSILGYYVLSEANVEPVYEFCTFEQFSGGVFRENLSPIESNKLRDIFNYDYKNFEKVMKLFNMEYENGNRDGKYLWNYAILPKIPVKFIFYEGDDEFPSKMQILYDKNTIKIFKFEQLAVLHISIIQTILSIGKINSNGRL